LLNLIQINDECQAIDSVHQYFLHESLIFVGVLIYSKEITIGKEIPKGVTVREKLNQFGILLKWIRVLEKEGFRYSKKEVFVIPISFKSSLEKSQLRCGIHF
jgi:hypothetical protein